MFSESQKTTNTPSSYLKKPVIHSTEMQTEINKLNETIELKKKQFEILNHLTSIPHIDETQKNIYESINESIKLCIYKLNEHTFSIVKSKCRILGLIRHDNYWFQVHIVANFLLNGHWFNYNSKREDIDYDCNGTVAQYLAKSCNINYITAIGANIESVPKVSNEQRIYFNKVRSCFETSSRLLDLANDERITAIANDIYAFITRLKPFEFSKTISPLMKQMYMQCIKFLVICVPYHDMANFKMYYRHFDGVNALVEHVLSLCNGEYYKFDNPGIANADVPILTTDDIAIGPSDIQYYMYPRIERPPPKPEEPTESIDVYVVMTYIFTIVCDLYERHM